MKAIKKLGQGVLVAIGVLGLAGAVSAAPKSITSCKTIDEPGSYLVTRNLTGSGICLYVDADDVAIDLGGYVLRGNGTGDGVTANAYRKGITVRNGTVTNFNSGVSLFGTGSIVEQVRAHDNTSYGIIVGNGALVKSSIASDNGDDGIFADPSSLITGSVATGNGLRGLVMWCPASAVSNTTTNNAGGNLVTVGAGCVLSQNLAP